MSETPEATVRRVIREHPEVGEVRLCFFGDHACYARAMPSSEHVFNVLRAKGLPPADELCAVLGAAAERQMAVGCGHDIASALRNLVVELSKLRARGVIGG